MMSLVLDISSLQHLWSICEKRSSGQLVILVRNSGMRTGLERMDLGITSLWMLIKAK